MDHLYVPEESDTLYANPLHAAAACDLIDHIGAAGPATIHAATFQTRYGRPGGRGPGRQFVFDVVRTGLTSQGVIETDGGYRAPNKAKGIEGKCRRYRLSDEWASRPIVRVPAAYEFQDRDRESALPVPRWSTYCDALVTFDLPGAHLWLMLDAGVSEDEARSIVDACDFPRGSRDGVGLVGAAVRRVAPQLVRETNSRVAHMWKWRVDRALRPPSRDPSGHRLHTPVSNLAKDLRAFVGLDSKAAGPLYEIDARNSQPAILAALAVSELGTADALHLASICAEGNFYEETHEIVKGRGFISDAERELWKETMFASWVYGDLEDMDNRACKALARAFPTVDAWIRKHKEKGTAALPCAMQRKEAAIWIDGLAPLLESRDIRAVTIHDSVLVSEADRDTVHALLRGLYSDAGIAARLAPKLVTVAAPGALQCAHDRNERKRAREARKQKQYATIKRNAKAKAASVAAAAESVATPLDIAA